MDKTIVVFDVGAVLLKFRTLSFFEKAAERSTTCTIETIKGIFDWTSYEVSCMKGELTIDEQIGKLNQVLKPTKPFTLEDLYSFCDFAPIEKMIELKRSLYRLGYSVGIISNIGEVVHQFIKMNWPDVFEVYEKNNPKILSYEVGSIKPDIEIFKLIKGFEKVVFIDDKISYLKPPIDELGWFGIQYSEYIDKEEIIRSIHNNNTLPETNYLGATTFDDLIKALITFNILIPDFPGRFS